MARLIELGCNVNAPNGTGQTVCQAVETKRAHHLFTLNYMLGFQVPIVAHAGNVLHVPSQATAIVTTIPPHLDGYCHIAMCIVLFVVIGSRGLQGMHMAKSYGYPELCKSNIAQTLVQSCTAHAMSCGSDNMLFANHIHLLLPSGRRLAASGARAASRARGIGPNSFTQHWC